MKPLLSEIEDAGTLQKLGRASVQIIHDLKNQINGLKLYATFLRKRMEKSERPPDEQETIAKLIAGLERAAADMATIVRYGRPIELRPQPHADLAKILSGLENGDGLRIEAGDGPVEGRFDVVAITEAFKTVTATALGMRPAEDDGPLSICLLPSAEGGRRAAVVEWRTVKSNNGTDPFRSFSGSDGLRMSLAARIIEAHGGEARQEANTLRVRLPLEPD
ncbi:MAG TPA: hypothetical protein VF723_16720 [Pyrinomonadaceae bacterium]|jgi:hypothetical protein